MAVQNDEKLNLKTKNTHDTKSDQQDESKTNGNNKKIKSENCKSLIKEEDKKHEKIKDEKDQENDQEKEDDDDELEEESNSNILNANVGKKSFLGHTCSVKTLIDDKVLVPENNALSFEFMVRLNKILNKNY